MTSNSSNTQVLYDKISLRYPLHRVFDITILLLLFSVLGYRLITLNEHGCAWLLAFLCESWFTFVWVLTVSTKWNPVEYKAYPERLSQRVEELPPVDMFVTTADPELEPTIMTVNTVLSLLAVDYPADKLACYVSDDGCSALTYYSLVEASKFASLWVPFCKKHNVQIRAPFRYFSVECKSPPPADASSPELRREWTILKDAYEELRYKIRVATEKSILSDVTGDLDCFSNVERRNHPTIIKVILENKGHDHDHLEGLPYLIYISREKRPKDQHHYKAGAMNVLTKVSGLMTNAPFMLNVDCDMYVNNPEVIRYAMCLFHGSKKERESGYVQAPQYFYDALKDDPFGNQMVVTNKYLGRGFSGLQGSIYMGTGCFHRRKVMYGLCPDDIGNEASRLTPVHANLDDKELQRIFGNSGDFIKSARNALQGNTKTDPKDSPELIEAAKSVASCGYDHNSKWGSEVGWRYGSTSEDLLTGLSIHGRGWHSLFFTMSPPAFMGCAPSGGPASLTQQKRWATGLLEVLVSRSNPIILTLTTKLEFRQSLAYLWVLLWNLRSIPELCYALLPAYCLITGSTFLPKFQEPAIYIFIALLTSYMVYYIVEYISAGLSIRTWWNNQKMARIVSASAWLFGVLAVLLKLLGISQTVFEVTQKDQSDDRNDGGSDSSRFTFDQSPIFIPGTTLLLVHLTSLVMGVLGLQMSINVGPGLGEMVCSALLVMCLWPFLGGLFRKGKYGIPLSIKFKSALLTLLFVHMCLRTTRG